jgi:chromosomal replication initiator protein
VLETIWQEFLNIIREEAGSRVVETWFKAVVFARWDKEQRAAYLKTPNSFTTQWLTSNYYHLFEKHLGRLLHERTIVIHFIEDDIPNHFYPAISDIVTPESSKTPLIIPATKASHNVKPALRTNTHNSHSSINPAYQFSSFVVGPNNSLAYAAAQAITEKPGTLYNPLFIYGDSGFGKTHLLHAIGNSVKARYPAMRMIYQSADRFVSEFINAIRFNKIYQFQLRYKDVDLLLIDDIQFISHKEQTQEAFFHIFNTLHQAHKQIVFSSDSLPRDIAGLANRMRSRLEGGLIVDIQMASLETKIAILKKKAQYQGQEISDEVAHFIASCVVSNIRELEGAFIRVYAFATLTNQLLTIELAQKVLLRHKETKLLLADLNQIALQIGQHFGYTLGEMRSNKRNKDLTLARHITLYFMKKMTKYSLREIGLFLSRKDHSTVIHACDKIEQYKQKNVHFSHVMQQLQYKLEL